MSMPTSALSAHYPDTYMQQICKNLHPDLELGTSCVNWFRQALKHCNQILKDTTPPTAYIWSTVKNFIFPNKRTDIASQKISINIHPNRLTTHDCQSLYLDIVRDYVERAPHYAAETAANALLWQVFYSLMGAMAMGCLVACAFFAYNRLGEAKIIINPIEDVFTPENCMRAAAKRSLCLAKTELRNIHLRPLALKQDIITVDGAPVLAITVVSKYDIMDSVVVGGLQSVGKLHRPCDPINKTKNDLKIEALNKAMKFLDNNCKKLHLLLMFEEDVDFEEIVVDRKCRSNNYSNNSSPLSSPRNIQFNTRFLGRLVAGSSTAAVNKSRPTTPPINSRTQTKSEKCNSGRKIPQPIAKRLK